MYAIDQSSARQRINIYARFVSHYFCHLYTGPNLTLVSRGLKFQPVLKGKIMLK